MLRTPDALVSFLDNIFSGTDMPISIKTRIGYAEAAEFPALLEIYNRYPICELIIHPRVRGDFYNGQVNMDVFRFAAKKSKNAICYNGDITNLSQIAVLPKVDAVMLGRGLIADPGLVCGDSSPETLKAYLTALLEGYIQVFGNASNAMFRLKEHWHYLQYRFEGCEKLIKQLRKTTDVDEFFSIMSYILDECPIKKSL